MSEFLLPQVEEWRNRAETAETEVERLKHQLAEQDARGLRLAGENERLREALRLIRAHARSALAEEELEQYRRGSDYYQKEWGNG